MREVNQKGLQDRLERVRAGISELRLESKKGALREEGGK